MDVMPPFLGAWVLAFGLAAFLVAVIALPLTATGIVRVRKLDLIEAVGWVGLAVIFSALITAVA